MPGPVTHVYVANTLVRAGAVEVSDFDSFLRGTVFNDIRYLRVLPRRGTHRLRIRWRDIGAARDSFSKGMLLHSLLDLVHGNYIESHGLLPLPSTGIARWMRLNRFHGRQVKFAEDTLLLERIGTDIDVNRIFSVIDEHELAFNVSLSDIDRWHDLVRTAFIESPTERFERFAEIYKPQLGPVANRNGITVRAAGKIAQLARNEQFIATIDGFHHNVAERLKLWPQRASYR